MNIKAISHTMIFTLDHARAIKWYVDILGFKVRFEVPGNYASLFHADLNYRLDLHPSEAGGVDVGHGPMLYFTTSNIEEDLQLLSQKGVKVSKARREGNSPLFATFWDSEGNALGLEEASKH